MQIVLDVARFKVPGDQGAVVATSVDQLVVSVVGDTHYVVSVS